MTEAERRLERLLSYIGSTSLLRRALARLPHGSSVVLNMPGESEPLSVQVTSAVRLLTSKGLVNEDLAAMLNEELPGRVDEIAEVMRGWTMPSSSAPVLSAPMSPLASPSAGPQRSLQQPQLLRHARPLTLFGLCLAIAGLVVVITLGTDRPATQPVATVAAVIIKGAVAGDSAGFYASNLGDGRVAIGAPNPTVHSGTRAQPGAVYLLSPPREGEVDLGSRESYNAKLTEGVAGDELGWRVLPTGDVNDDAVTDLFVVGAAKTDTQDGVVYLISGRLQGEVSITPSSPWALATIHADRPGDILGGDILVGQSHNGAVTLISAPDAEGHPDYPNSGLVYVVPMRAIYPGALLDPSQPREANVGSLASAVWSIEDSRAHAGWSLSAGDVNGDGQDDYLVSVQNGCKATRGSGVYLVLGGQAALTGNHRLADIGIGYFAGPCEAQWGMKSEIIGDINGDGANDIAIAGRFMNEGTGRVAIVEYERTPFKTPTPVSEPNRIIEFASLNFYGEQKGDQYGISMAWLNDMNGDKEGDFMVGALHHDSTGRPGVSLGQHALSGCGQESWSERVQGADQGQVYLYLGPLKEGSVEPDAKWYGVEGSGHVGDRLHNLGDLNNDGLTDFFIGAPGEYGKRGAGYLFYGDASLGSP